VIVHVARRLGFYALAAWASLTFAFVLPRLMPGDPASAIFARFRGKLSPEAMQALRAALGFTAGSTWHQYGSYLAHLARGDLGLSISHFPAPVSAVIGRALGWTLLMGGVAVVFSFALGTTLGVLAAGRRGRWFDALLPPLLGFVGAFPYFWLAMLVLFFGGLTLGWFPLGHAYDAGLPPGLTLDFAASVLRHAVLPGATVVLATVGGWTLAMRNTTLRTLADDHVLLARAKGLPPRQILFRYAARGALLPNLAAFGLELGFVLSGSVLTEIVFSYPGMGSLLVGAVQSLDYPLLQGLFLVLTLSVLGANWLVDLLSTFLDPRLRSERRS
jgi:peptide/nickel transport system permease protein